MMDMPMLVMMNVEVRKCIEQSIVSQLAVTSI